MVAPAGPGRVMSETGENVARPLWHGRFGEGPSSEAQPGGRERSGRPEGAAA